MGIIAYLGASIPLCTPVTSVVQGFLTRLQFALKSVAGPECGKKEEGKKISRGHRGQRIGPRARGQAASREDCGREKEEAGKA